MTDLDFGAAQEAVNRIQRLSDTYWHALDASCRAMDDDAWVGPAGRRFHDDVQAQRRELWDQLTQAVHAAEAKLRSLPRKP
ncbi:hypothetical protein FM076_29520 [Streptomyces albus subsp. chlorinus]|uniref:hypothetical protein n=1 Tax=Streptomyces albus TaxID=1888 RepID=UPI001570EB42|nr:hypothetical protein [Streptomyces albus]NSC25077.1 hypothetical protein [Streptomyces albus subsp. chlorinus]